MAGQEVSKVMIEPKAKVVEALRLALAQTGSDYFLERVEATRVSLEKWVNGQEWIPLRVVREACEINRKNSDAPSYSKSISECTSEAQFRIAAGEEVEKREVAAVKGITIIGGKIPEKGAGEKTATATKPKASFQVVKVTLALFFVPMMGAVLGFFVGGPLGAAAGAISCYVIVAAISLAFFILSSKRSRTL